MPSSAAIRRMGKSQFGESIMPTKRSGSTLFLCFNLLLFLAALEACCLLSLGFFSDHLELDKWTNGGMEAWAWRVLFEMDEGDDDSDDDLSKLEEDMAEHHKMRRGRRRQDSYDSDRTNHAQRLHHKGPSYLNTSFDLNVDGDPIDDYFSRKHIQGNVPLVVGGSDGSGTRAFVDVLGKLGVPMLVDDAGTMDVHASKMYGGHGWPPLVAAVLSETHSTNYEAEQLQENVKNSTQRELAKLAAIFERRVEKMFHKIIDRNLNETVAGGVSFGFKAPITMLLVPLIQKYMYPQLKYLHIVRDGRDVALSSNQSPVKKFYNITYPDAAERLSELKEKFGPVLGLQLWNDWNLGLNKWGLEHNDGKSFDYLAVRTEDLLNPATKFDTLVQLAHFVGSRRSHEELCCMSRKAVVDMGKSVGGKKKLTDDTEPAAMMNSEMLQQKKQFLSREARKLGKSPSAMTPMERMHAIKSFRESFGMGVEGPGRRNGLRMLKRFMQEQNREKEGSTREDRGRRRLVSDSSLLEREFRYKRGFSLPSGKEHSTAHAKLQGWRKRQLYKLKGRKLDASSPLLKWFGALGRDSAEDKELGDLIADQLDRLSEKAQNRTGSTQRYGKWAALLSGEPELLQKMLEEGKEALAAFGYEPNMRFLDRSDDKFICNEAVVCADKEIGAQSELAKADKEGQLDDDTEVEK